MSRWIDAWRRFWFAATPSHPLAVLRIAFGALGLLNLAGMREVRIYWRPDGILPPASHPEISAWLVAHDLAGLAGVALFAAVFACYAAMTIGFRSHVAVVLSLLAGLAQLWWNSFPLSAAFELWLDVVFCLVWADTGAVWSLDAYLARRRGAAETGEHTQPIWPLRLVQIQVGIVYVSAVLWKLLDPHWRDGSALHYILSGTIYTRFPAGPPLSLDGLLVVMTYTTLAWELAFPFLVAHRKTRTVALLSGVGIHLGMWALLEIGPFTLVILATYLAFWSPPASFAGSGRDRRLHSPEVRLA